MFLYSLCYSAPWVDGASWLDKKKICYLVYDLKMDFTRKARWVKDRHKYSEIYSLNFTGVVSRKSVGITFTYAVLNDLDVSCADIQNAYLTVSFSEKHYIICLEHEGKVSLIIKLFMVERRHGETTGLT